MISSNFVFNFISFFDKITNIRYFIFNSSKLVILGILFLILFILALRAAVVAKLVIPGVLFLTFFILALRIKLVAKVVCILSSIFLILALHISFLMTLFFTTSLSLLQSTGTSTNLSTSDLSTLTV